MDFTSRQIENREVAIAVLGEFENRPEVIGAALHCRAIQIPVSPPAKASNKRRCHRYRDRKSARPFPR